MKEKDLLTARGIASELRDDGETVGHVLLMDYDDGVNPDRVFRENANLPGLTAVFESSPGSYHVHNYTIRTKDKTALAMLGRKVDPMHISVGYRRGRWTLRVSEKDRVNASEGSEASDLPGPYKSAPELIEHWINGTERPCSAPHVTWFERNILGEPVDRSGLDTVTAKYRHEKYLTLTDSAKDEW